MTPPLAINAPVIPVGTSVKSLAVTPVTFLLKFTVKCTVAAVFGVLSYRCALPFYRPTAAGLRNLGFVLKEATTPNALIIAADDGDPTVFYYAHRKGWHFLEDGIYQGNPLDSAQVIANLERLRNRGEAYRQIRSPGWRES